MTLAQIKYFCAACKYGSITRAAEELYVTQPTITVAIRELEKEFQLLLLTGRGKATSLTAEGQLIYQYATGLLEQVNEFERVVKDMARKDKSIRLGVTKGIGASIYAEYMANREEESCNIELCLNTSARLIEMLGKKQLDAIIIPDYGIDALKDLEHKVLKKSYMYFCMSKKHPLVKKEKISVDMIVNEKFISTENDEFKNKALKCLFEENGYSVTPNVIAQYDQLSIVMKMIEAGLGVGYFSGEAIGQYSGIVAKRIEREKPILVRMVWRAENTGKELSDFIQEMRNFCAHS